LGATLAKKKENDLSSKTNNGIGKRSRTTGGKSLRNANNTLEGGEGERVDEKKKRNDREGETVLLKE